jgi:quinohemoprotein ethanol dehydrogenase
VGTGKAVSMVDVSMSTVELDAQDKKGALVAYDPVLQTIRWKVQHEYFWNGGTLATGGGLVFQGTADGYFDAYDALSGARVWRFNAGLGIVAAPISYSVSGIQYVSILVGYGGSNSAGNMMNAGWKYGAQTRRLLTFRLDGKTALPAMPPPDFTVHPADSDPSVKLDADAAARGERSFSVNCGGCHGLAAISAGAPGPDLRESRAALDPKALWSILHDGALLPRGMPRFDKLDAGQVEEISAYIRLKQRAVLNGQSTPPDSNGHVM